MIHVVYPLAKLISALTEVPMLLAYYEAKLSLLLRISQSKLGAAHVMSAGFFQAVRASGLFTVDPDLGLGRLALDLST